MDNDAKFDVFFELVQQTAKAQGKCFFMDCGEGHNGETDTMEMEDLSGWLVPLDQEVAFQHGWLIENVSGRFDGDFVFAKWTEDNGNVQVRFEKPPA